MWGLGLRGFRASKGFGAWGGFRVPGFREG